MFGIIICIILLVTSILPRVVGIWLQDIDTTAREIIKVRKTFILRGTVTVLCFYEVNWTLSSINKQYTDGVFFSRSPSF